MVQIQRSSGNGMSFDLKSKSGGSSHLVHHPHSHLNHMDLSAHSALSHYTSQMGMKAAMVEASRYGGHVAPGPPTPSAAGGPPRSTITDFFGKMMSFSSCQSPVLPTYYQNAIYSTEKLESHLWFSHYNCLHEIYLLWLLCEEFKKKTRLLPTFFFSFELVFLLSQIIDNIVIHNLGILYYNEAVYIVFFLGTKLNINVKSNEKKPVSIFTLFKNMQRRSGC